MRLRNKGTKSPLLLNISEYFIMYGWALFVIFPFAWMISLSLRETEAVYKNLFFQSLDEVTFFNYVYLIKGEFPYRHIQIFFINALKNSFIAPATSVVIILAISILAGYAFAKLRFFGKNGLFYFILAGMMVPAQVMSPAPR